MIPQFYRIIVLNESGQTVSYDTNGRFSVRITGIHIDPTTLKVTYTQFTADDCSFAATDTVTDGAEVKSDEYDNTSNLYIGLIVQVLVTHDEGAAADGVFTIYLDGSSATGDLASDQTGYTNAQTDGLLAIGTVVWDQGSSDDDVRLSKPIRV
jgi:hypothetical protein